MPSRPFVVTTLLAAGLCALSATSRAQDTDPTHTARSAYHQNGRVDVTVKYGDVEIVPSADDSIVVTWSGENADRAHAEITIKNGVASVRTSGEHNNVHYTVRLPRRSDLVVRSTAGDIRVGAFEGNEDVAVTMGDLHVGVLDPAEYAAVRASTRLGDLTAGPFATEEHGTFGKSIEVSGSGALTLRAHVGVGDLTLQRGVTMASGD